MAPGFVKPVDKVITKQRCANDFIKVHVTSFISVLIIIIAAAVCV